MGKRKRAYSKLPTSKFANNCFILQKKLGIHIYCLFFYTNFQVSQQWKAILSQKQFWIQKCKREGYRFPAALITNAQVNWMKVGYFLPFNRNFIKDKWDEKNRRFERDERWESRENSHFRRGYRDG